MTPIDVSDSQKKLDIILALHISNHTSIRSVDHLGELLNKHFGAQKGTEVRIHRTKCSSIILNVLVPAFREELHAEIGNAYFSIILDESTDVSQQKLMSYCIRYFNGKLGKIVVDFLGFQPVTHTTAVALDENFRTFMADLGLNLSNMLSIATDGAANLCGKNHSLFTLLKQRYPKLQLLRCVCHSLSKCAQKACEELPSHLEFLLRETRHWFSHSPLRMQVYENIYRQLNHKKKPPKLTSLSPTRWLAFNSATKENITQWHSLKAHFVQISKSTDRSAICYVGRTLASMYEEDGNYLYFLFMNSVLDDVDRMNLVFQSDKVNIVKAYDDLRLLIIQCSKRIFKPSFLKIRCEENSNIVDKNAAELETIKFAVTKTRQEIGNSVLHIDSIDYGHNFQDFVSKSHNISQQQLCEIKRRCASFLIRLCEELIARLPSNFAVIEKVKFFSPKYCIGPNKKNYDELPLDLLPENSSFSVERIRAQWSRLQSLRIEEIYDDTKRNLHDIDIIEFWKTVSDMQNALSEPVFKELAQFALLALSLPISNAVVERVFSVMNTVKN